jgi:hypothetical protein
VSDAIRNLSSSVKVWLALMVYLALVKLVITLFPAAFRSVEQAAVFEWAFLGVWTVVGLAGIWFSRRTGFPEAWDRNISAHHRFLIPALLGLAFSVPFIVIDARTGFTTTLAVQHGQPRMNIDLPVSALIYPGGAIIVEAFYRLVPIPLFLWLISNIILKKRGQGQVFWILAFLTSLIEPLTQDLDLGQFGMLLMASVFLLDYGLNLTQAALFRKYGFLAAIIMRVAYYVVWHILYVH